MNTTVMAMLLIAVHVMICVLLCVLSRVGGMRALTAYTHADSRG